METDRYEEMVGKAVEATFLREGFVMGTPRQSKMYADFGYAVKDSGTAVIPVNYPLGADYLPYSYITGLIENALNDKRVEDIVLSIDSPGGAVVGLFDACRYIEEASKKKKCVAYVTGMACSAAYALATACSAIYLMEDAEVGSCGCYAHAVEYSEEFYKKAGFIHRIFRSKCSPKKNCSLINDEAEAKAFEAEVDALGEKYLSYVAERRGVSYDDALSGFGQGGTLRGEEAVKAGMADGICTLEALSSMGEENTGSLSGSEGEDMDITAMSGEERKNIFSMLCSTDPELMAETIKTAKEEERGRILALHKMKDGSAEVDAIVDAAVADGRAAESIAMEVIGAMKESAQKAKAEADEGRKKAIESLVGDTTEVSAPLTATEGNPYLAAAKEMNKE